MVSFVKRAVKKVVGSPEENVPVVSTRDWLKGLSRDPLKDVRYHEVFFTGVLNI